MQSFIMEVRKLFPTENIEEDTKLEECEWWDSMAIMDIITLADEKYSIILDVDNLRSAKTVSDLFYISTGKKNDA